MSPTATAADGPLYGGPRLQPAHFEPDRVPVEVARHGVDPHTLQVGSPGKVGILELDFELRGAADAGSGLRRTDLVHHYQKTPLQIMRPLYYNPLRPDMPYTYILTTGGGVLHGDRQRTDLRFGAGTSAHVTTQAHTKLYRMETGYATALVNIDVEAGAYAEYLPDPVIPFAGSRYYQRVAVTMQEGASLVTGETIYAGRLTRGEHNQYDVYASDFEVRRVGGGAEGRPLAIDRVRLVPERGHVGGLAVLDGRDIFASLYVLSGLVPAARIADALYAAVGAVVAASDDPSARFGVSVLPGDTGAWLRLIADDTITALASQTAAAAAAHELLTGRAAPRIRKS
ncbi:urease accessory protein UreD [Microbacterium pygmaeum]|uniref:Urease accessory protein UreD n=1 Tax=Microbacterium pygmaeum TaxID=370764 RepID=A0A1G8DNM9_9MICO|nr:urease accessory protein UreD [Microbacterium pygmaeum]SDH59222.1 urease accessory protein [Microbacterium pygmaeum]